MFSIHKVFILAMCATIGSAVDGWTYVNTSDHCAGTSESPCGPDHWGTVNHNCDGHSQSPIDISNAEIELEAAAPEFNVIGRGCHDWTQFSDVSTFEVHMEGCTNLTVTYGDVEYELRQLHFHSPSEHSIGGGYYSGEVHMVHRHISDYLIVTVMLEVTPNSFITASNNSFLDNLWSHGGTHTVNGEEVHLHDDENPVNPYLSFLPASPMFYTYSGSFTVPPCTEGAQWLVYDKPVMISHDDLRIIRAAMASATGTIVTADGNNNRPVQDTYSRSISMYAGTRGHVVHESVVNPNYDEVKDATNKTIALGASSIALSCILLTVTMCLCVQLRQKQVKSSAPYAEH